MKAWWLLSLLLIALVSPLQAQTQNDAEENQLFTENHLTMLAADLASLALRMARHSAGRNTSHPHVRHRKQRLIRHRTIPAVEHIDSGFALSVPISFHGHNLTVMTLKK
jgi:hypothetical protein